MDPPIFLNFVYWNYFNKNCLIFRNLYPDFLSGTIFFLENDNNCPANQNQSGKAKFEATSHDFFKALRVLNVEVI